MNAIIGNLKFLAKSRKGLIDNPTFQLHYQFTCAILVAASVMTTANQFFGEPIDCIVDDGVPQSVFNIYCWIHGTFTLPSHLTGNNQPYPGVGPSFENLPDPNLMKTTEKGDEIRHAWYQWVAFVILLQALLCYFPHFLWKSWEGGKIEILLQNLDRHTLEPESEVVQARVCTIVNYVFKHLRKHNLYVYQFIFCEFLNLGNILGQMYLMDVFFAGQFTSYGFSVISLSLSSEAERIDPVARIFPKMTKCTFHKYGSSGTIQTFDGLCVLPINIINEKIFIFLWFWYFLLITWTTIYLSFRVVTLFSKYVRYLIFCGNSTSSSSYDVGIIMEHLWFGDWFILMQLCNNMDPTVFHEVVLQLRNKLDPFLAFSQPGGRGDGLSLIEKRDKRSHCCFKFKKKSSASCPKGESRLLRELASSIV